MSHVTPTLFVTLAEVVPELHLHCVDPWCVIGSAAARLAGIDTAVADVDLLTSREDAGRLRELWADRRDEDFVPEGTGHFRSDFARFRFAGLPVEVMGGLEVRAGDGWHRVQIDRLMLVGLEGMPVPVPPVAEQIRMLKRFGRAKDRLRAAQLEQLEGVAP